MNAPKLLGALADLPPTIEPPKLQVRKDRRLGKRLYILIGVIVALLTITVAFLVPQAFGTAIALSLNYTVGEKMVYTTTNTVTNQMSNTSINMETNPISDSYNSTSSYEILSFDGETYTIKLKVTSEINGKTLSIPLTTNISKTNYYKDFLSIGGAPQFFSNVSGNPTLASYFAKTQVNVGETWQFPVSTGNSSLGVTGELTISYGEIQELTVPAGTYKVFIVEISSNALIMHVSADNGIISGTMLDNTELQISGKIFLEYGTCRLVKSAVTQECTFQATGISGKTIIASEKILVEHTKP